jgi:peptidoglycan/xylan/chitin deacetylase (PgdA/CDA1 family)
MPYSSFNILAYHRVTAPGSRDLSSTLIDAYPEDFEEQMRYLARHYNVVSSWDVVRGMREGYTLPKRALVITFDDGYTCFRDTAMPVLRRLGLPVTLFVATAFTSAPSRLFWWDAVYRALLNTTLQEVGLPGMGHLPLRSMQERIAAYERIVPYIETLEEREAARLVGQMVDECAVEPNCTAHLLGWDDVEALAAEGIAVGPHSRHHPILARCAPERVREEVEGSWADLNTHIDSPVPIFCYPNGQPHAVSRTAREAVRDTGLAGAVTMVAGLNVLGRTDPFLLHRTGAVAGESLGRFRFKIGPAGRIYRRIKALATRKPHTAFDA